MNDTTEERVANGRFNWLARYRHIRGDQGVSVRLVGPVNGQPRELARFDCLQADPHYHIAFFDRNEIFPVTDKEDSFGFIRHKVIDNLEKLVCLCGGDVPTEQELFNHHQVLRTLAARVRHIYEFQKSVC